jgi:TctA family transporter
MEALGYLVSGFAAALTPMNLAFALIGAVLGTLVGVLPGIGPTSGIAILLPLTAVLPPTPAIIMLAAIYYGAMYGGSTTAILVNIPGEVASVVTTLDGYQMARQGRAGPALAIAAISSFVAGTLSLFGLALFAPSLADLSLRVGPPENFGIVILAFSVIVNLSGPSLLRGLTSSAVGVLIALVGLDPQSGVRRFSLGTVGLLGGIDFIAVIIGLFAFAEVFLAVGEGKRSVSMAPWDASCRRGRTSGAAWAPCCAPRASASASACCPGARRGPSPSWPTIWSERSPGRGPASGRGPSRAWRPRRAPTTRAPAAGSCPCWPWASRRPRLWPCS